MKDFHKLMSDLSESSSIGFGKIERTKAHLEGRSISIPIMQGGLVVGHIRGDFDIHGKGATSRAQGYQVISGYSVEYYDPAINRHHAEDSVTVGGAFDTPKKALDEVKRRVVARFASLGRSAEGIPTREMPTLRDRLKANPKAWAHWSYVETVLPQIAAGQSVVPPTRPDVVGVMRWSGNDELWISCRILRSAIVKLFDTKELALVAQLKKLLKALPDLSPDVSPATARLAVSGAIMQFNKIRSMMDRP